MNRPAEIRPASRDTRRAPELREWRCQCGHLLLRLGDGPTPLIESTYPTGGNDGITNT